MRVLIIAYHFPPDAEIGAVRPYQLARLLPQHGIEPWILTVQPEFIQQHDEDSRIDGIPAEHIVRTPVGATQRIRLIRAASSLKNRLRPVRRDAVAFATSPGAVKPAGAVKPHVAVEPDEGWMRATPWRRWLLNWLWFPDVLAGWQQPALAAADELLKQTRFNVLLSTSPPRVVHFIARELAIRHRLPWVMDLRDPWFKDVDETGSRILDKAYQRLFIPCAHRADKIVLNTTPLLDEVNTQWPQFAAKTIAIPNGCSVPQRKIETGNGPAHFTIGHYGSVYSKRDPAPFLHGLRLWLDHKVAEGSTPPVSVRFVGPESGTAPEYIARYDLSSIVSLCPAVGRERVAEMMQEDYILLLIANKMPLQIPGKLYEYLAARRRVLATAEPDCPSADLLRRATGSVLASSAEEVAAALETFWQQFSSGSPAEVAYDALLDECSYERRAAAMAEVLHGVVASRA